MKLNLLKKIFNVNTLKSPKLDSSPVKLFTIRKKKETHKSNRQLPTREQQLESLRKEQFDILIIGGGATGAGCALDATTRGLKTALVEMDDFASGTSSRSTKLIHGGVRYLQSAIMKFDIEQFKMVMEALRERDHLLKVAPHLTRQIPILLPVHKWWQLPYFWSGMKMYDVLAFSHFVKRSYLLSKKKTLEAYPLLKSEGLCGSIVYYDGQMDDSRMNLTLIITATRAGATVANHMKVLNLIKENEIIAGAVVKDELTGKEWPVKAKCVVNATGAMIDSIRKMDNPKIEEICIGSLGTHVILPKYYSPPNMGLLDPETSDNRVIFFLPWQNHVVAGTTDLPAAITHHPQPTKPEVSFILKEIRGYLNDDIKVRRGDVLSVWSGIRPLVRDVRKTDTKTLVRNHIVIVSKSKLVTIAGGKWTTYRSMAEETINEAIKACNLQPQHAKCRTYGLPLDGGECWSPEMYISLVQNFGLSTDVAENMSHQYGTRAFDVIKFTSRQGINYCLPVRNRLHPEFPYTVADVKYGVYEYACTAIDMIARRLRIAFLNREAAKKILKDVIVIMSEELHWDEKEIKKQINDAYNFLQNEMDVSPITSRTVKLSEEKRHWYTEKFKAADQDLNGYLSTVVVLEHLEEMNQELSQSQLHKLLGEVDAKTHGQINLQEYLMMMEIITKARDPKAEEEIEETDTATDTETVKVLKKCIPIERSGGGV